jgi:4-hydroxy-tetrahydrodipicolinate synthase
MDIITNATHTLLVTPFDQYGELDTPSLSSLIDFTLGAGAAGVVALGTTGEFFTLTPMERHEVMKHVVDHVGGNAPVTVGVGADGTAGAVALAQHAQDAGADCIMVLPPLYFDLSPEAQIHHFTTVANSVNTPVMLYDGAGGIPVSHDVIAAVAKEAGNVKYAKLALPDPSRVRAVVTAAPGVIPLAGDDTTLVAALRNGARGSAIATGNIQAREVTEVHRAFDVGDITSAAEKFAASLAPSIMATSTPKTEFIARFKEVLAAKGIIASAHIRSPLRPVDPEDRDELLDVMRYLGVL